MVNDLSLCDLEARVTFGHIFCKYLLIRRAQRKLPKVLTFAGGGPLWLLDVPAKTRYRICDAIRSG